MREAVKVARTDSDTISNVFLSTVKGSTSTFLLESRELTLDDVNCLRTSTSGSERSRSNKSAALSTALLALDTDGAGEEEWLVGTPPENKGGKRKAAQSVQPMASIPEAIYCSAPQIRNTHDGPPRASQRKRSVSTPEQATVFAVTAGAGLPALNVSSHQTQRDQPWASCIPGPVSPPRSLTSTTHSQSPLGLPRLPRTPTATAQRSTELRTPPGSGSRIPRPGSGALAGKGGVGVGNSPGGTRIPSKLRPPSSREPKLKDLEDGWHSCIDKTETVPFAEALRDLESVDAPEKSSGSATNKSPSGDAVAHGLQDVVETERLKEVAEKSSPGPADHTGLGHSRQGSQEQAAKTGCACCTVM